MRLPPDLYGDIVLIQWYYLTANSCVHEGYDKYNWPEGWDIPAADKCPHVSSDGLGTPEQFWNCAEVKIEKDANYQQEQQQQQQSQTQSNPTTEVSTAFSVDAVSAGDHKIHDKTIIGYYASWQWYDRAKLAKPQNMNFSKVQRVNFAFFQTNESGDIWGTDSWADPNLLFVSSNMNCCNSLSPLLSKLSKLFGFTRLTSSSYLTLTSSKRARIIGILRKGQSNTALGMPRMSRHATITSMKKV